MANYNLTNQAIEDSFQPLLQIDSGSALRDGTGSLVDNIIVTSSYALTASFAENAGTLDTGSLLTTASFDNGTRDLTFTKGDSSTFDVNIPGSSIDTGSFATTGSNNFFGNQTISGSVESTYNLSNTHLNPKTITDNITIPTGLNGVIIGDTTIVGDYTVEGDSEIYIFTEPPLGEYLTTASYLVDSSSFDTRINNISVDTSSLATTGSNTFIGNQIITGSLELYQNNSNSEGIKFITASGEFIQLAFTSASNSSPAAFSIINDNFGRIFDININNGVFEFQQTANFNSNLISRGITTIRRLDQESNFTASLQRTEINDILELKQSDPLPTGKVGEVAVSGSELYFHDGTNWRTVNLT
jgi:hypothetical protein